MMSCVERSRIWSSGYVTRIRSIGGTDDLFAAKMLFAQGYEVIADVSEHIVCCMPRASNACGGWRGTGHFEDVKQDISTCDIGSKHRAKYLQAVLVS